MINLVKIVALACVVLAISGCSHRMGNLSIVSTNNVDGLKTEVSAGQRVKGRSCNHSVLVVPWGDFQNRIQIATDNAIDNGRTAGLKGDALLNAKIDVVSWTAIVYSRNCLYVEGDLVQLSDSMK